MHVLGLSVASIPRPGIVGQRVCTLVILIRTVELFTAEMVTIKLPSAMDEYDYFPTARPTKCAINLFSIYFGFSPI